jgi:hypothetical protein
MGSISQAQIDRREALKLIDDLNLKPYSPKQLEEFLYSTSDFTYMYLLYISRNFVAKKLYEKLLHIIKKMKRSEVKMTPDQAKRALKFVKLSIKILYAGGTKPAKDPNDLVISLGDTIEINEPGIYVRYTPGMKLSAWEKQFERAKLISYGFELIKAFKNKKLPKPIQRDQIGKDDESKLDTYGDIEKRIEKKWHDHQQGLISDPVYDVQSDTIKSGESIIDSVFEDIACENNDSDDFHAEDKKKAELRNLYYSIVKRYNLPTIRDLPHYLKLVSDL